jgi:hypothetical protein
MARKVRIEIIVALATLAVIFAALVALAIFIAPAFFD